MATYLSRRDWFSGAAALAGGALVAATPRSAFAVGANRKVRVGLIGCGGRGVGVAKSFAAEQDCELTWLCDPDAQRLADAKRKLGAGEPVADLRRILDDKSVDAVIVATPDHWHAPAAILACAAGKHVYVEKPCSHNLREGRLLVEAARRNQRVVQHGTQARTARFTSDAIKMLHDGVIGDVLLARAWNVQRRKNIGHMQPSEPPADLNYDLWVGPAEMVPYQANRLHYFWHWWYNFGTGDTGNDGVHELDLARWGLGVETHPAQISGSGVKLYFDDDQQFPDTQTIVYDYPAATPSGRHKQLVWEMRIWSTNYPYNVDGGMEFFGTAGKMFLSKRGKLEVFGDRNVRIDKPELNSDAKVSLDGHQAQFLAAIRDGVKPTAEIEIGHLSASLCHLGNIVARTGRALKFDPQREQIAGDEEANRLLGRTYRQDGHWAVPKVG
jgi:predicted dehydrogenase